MKQWMKGVGILLVGVLGVLGCGGSPFEAGFAPATTAEATASSATGGGDGGEGGGSANVATGTGGEPAVTTSTASTASSSSSGQGGAGGCEPQTCEDLGMNCGPVDDGCGSAIDCGSCPLSQSCGGDGVPHVCGGCVPQSCEDQLVTCGVISDGCGNSLNCGNYDPIVLQNYPSNLNTACKQAEHPLSYACQNPGDGTNNPEPVGHGDCVPNMYPDYGWCCTE